MLSPRMQVVEGVAGVVNLKAKWIVKICVKKSLLVEADLEIHRRHHEVTEVAIGSQMARAGLMTDDLL